MTNEYPYRYEPHCHTSQTSACGRMTGAELARFYKNHGYTGIIVTDHFFNGNTTVPRTGMSWEARVDMFMRGYEDARMEGERIGLDVFFAWEYTYNTNDFLTYGLGRDWLLENPDCCDIYPDEYFERVRTSGGFVVQAHPFRERDYVRMLCLFPRWVFAAETDNAADPELFNERARMFAGSYSLLQTSGSDLHELKDRHRLAGVDSSVRFRTASDYPEALKAGNCVPFSLTLD